LERKAKIPINSGGSGRGRISLFGRSTKKNEEKRTGKVGEKEKDSHSGGE